MSTKNYKRKFYNLKKRHAKRSEANPSASPLILLEIKSRNTNNI